VGSEVQEGGGTWSEVYERKTGGKSVLKKDSELKKRIYYAVPAGGLMSWGGVSSKNEIAKKKGLSHG